MNINKVIKNSIGKIMLVTAIFITIPVAVSAANSDWSGYVASPGSSVYTSGKTKTSRSSVIFNYSTGSSASVGATVWSQNTSGTYKNVTYPGKNYIISKGNTYYDLLNNASPICIVRVKVITSAAGTHSGKWRPDL